MLYHWPHWLPISDNVSPFSVSLRIVFKFIVKNQCFECGLNLVYPDFFLSYFNYRMRTVPPASRDLCQQNLRQSTVSAIALTWPLLQSSELHGLSQSPIPTSSTQLSVWYAFDEIRDDIEGNIMALDVYLIFWARTALTDHCSVGWSSSRALTGTSLDTRLYHDRNVLPTSFATVEPNLVQADASFLLKPLTLNPQLSLVELRGDDFNPEQPQQSSHAT